MIITTQHFRHLSPVTPISFYLAASMSAVTRIPGIEFTWIDLRVAQNLQHDCSRQREQPVCNSQERAAMKLKSPPRGFAAITAAGVQLVRAKKRTPK
jgi:hypothetical protein